MSPAFYLLSSAFIWNFALSLSQVVVPLYAYHLGFSGLAIGSLVALPTLANLTFRLISGAVGVRWGERNVLILTYAAMALSGLMLFFAHTYALLLIAQFVSNISRGMYWVGAQTVASRLPGSPRLQLGRLLATYNLGQIIGTLSAGFFLVRMDYSPTFLIVAVAGTLALLASLGLPKVARTTAGVPVLTHFGLLLRTRATYFAMFASFTGAQAFSLSMSFHPVYLAQMGFDAEAIGGLISLRAIGSVAAGLFLARFLRPGNFVRATVLSLVGTGITIGLTPISPAFLVVGLLLSGLGIACGIMDLISQLTATLIGERHHGIVAAALAVGGAGWSLSHIFVGTFFGAMADTWGLGSAFHIWGGVMLTLALVAPGLHRWAFADFGPPAAASPASSAS